jgi:hypothetical protein
MIPVDTTTCPMCGATLGEGQTQCSVCGETLTPGSQFPAGSLIDFARAKRRRLIWLLVLAAVSGFAMQAFEGAETEIEILEGISIAVLVTSWCSVDAHERDTTIGKLQFVGLVFFTLIALPVYFVRTRGLPGVLSTLVALLFYIGMIGVQIAAMVITSFLV